MMLLVSILVILAVTAIAKVYNNVFKFRFICKIPGPKSLPLIGNVYTVLLPLDILFKYLRKLQTTYGGIYQLHACNIRTINVSNPADVEGHDTTAMALSFMIMRIANETTIQNNIYKEMNSIFGQSERTATMEDLNKMKYLECCIKESLRLYPSVPFIARYITNEVELSGYRIPEGIICNIHIYDMYINSYIFPEPEKFVPERFLPENSATRHPYSYMPFSAGPRNCIGQKFAMLEMKTIMSSVIRRYRLEPVTKPEDITFTCDLILRAIDPIYVQVFPRDLHKANKTST